MRAEDRTTDGLSTDDLVQPRDRRHDQDEQPAGMRPAQDQAPREVADDDPQRAGLRSHQHQTGEHAVADETTPGQAVPGREGAADGDDRVELFRPEQVEEFRTRWQDVQTSFVDDPQRTMRDADQLVAEVMQALASTFADHKHQLEAQWQRGGEVATEDLRLALRRYRTFFNELLRS